jgi:hypothetical protein
MRASVTQIVYFAAMASATLPMVGFEAFDITKMLAKFATYHKSIQRRYVHRKKQRCWPV